MVTELDRAGPARALLRHRRRGRQHPHRRGADAADHQRPGRGVGRPVLPRSPASCPASSRGPKARTRRAATTSSTSRTSAVSPTEEGVDKIEKLLGVDNLYDADPRLARHFEQALRAHALYKRDRDYIVKDGEIIIVDEFTGRQMPGRRWSEGLHQAIEAKEGLRVQRESVTLATITFQNYFRLYDKLAGMTGTAMTEAEEFHKIYKLEVVGDPDPPADDPRRRDRPRLPQRGRPSSTRSSTRSPRCRRPAGRSSSARSRSRSPSTSARCSKRRGHQARGPERQVPREGIGDRRPGRPDRRGHDRHEHGRPRHRHPARRQPRRPGLGAPPPARA